MLVWRERGVQVNVLYRMLLSAVNASGTLLPTDWVPHTTKMEKTEKSPKQDRKRKVSKNSQTLICCYSQQTGWAAEKLIRHKHQCTKKWIALINISSRGVKQYFYLCPHFWSVLLIFFNMFLFVLLLKDFFNFCKHGAAGICAAADDGKVFPSESLCLRQWMIQTNNCLSQ